MIDGCVIFRQVRHDLFGSKDAQDASTLTYTWVADQFGHVTLGFVVTLALWVALPIGWAAVVVAIGITVKEAYDYFCELDRRQSAFPFDRGDVLFNCATSCIYTWIGAALAVAAVLGVVHGFTWKLLLAPALLVLSLPIAIYWLRRKIALQQSDVPFLYRLANFPENFDGPDGPGIITNLVSQTAPQFRHVVLTGPLNSGKTSLAVGTATEFGYRVGLCRFISLVKLVQTGFSPGQERRSGQGCTSAPRSRTAGPSGLSTPWSCWSWMTRTAAYRNWRSIRVLSRKRLSLSSATTFSR